MEWGANGKGRAGESTGTCPVSGSGFGEPGSARAALTSLTVLQGIFISRIAEGGAAHRDGILHVGDRVISVSVSREGLSQLQPFLGRGCFSPTGAGFWGSFCQLLLSAPEPSGGDFMWVVLPCVLVGAVTPRLSPGALCCPQGWRGGRGHSSSPSPVPLWGLGQGRGSPWGTVGRQGQRGLQLKELPRGSSVLPCLTWSSALGLPSCLCGSHCSHLVSLPPGPRCPPVGASPELPKLFPRWHAASGGFLQLLLLLLVVGLCPAAVVRARVTTALA